MHRNISQAMLSASLHVLHTRAIVVALALGIAALLLLFLPGNLNVIGPVLGVWTYTITMKRQFGERVRDRPSVCSGRGSGGSEAPLCEWAWRRVILALAAAVAWAMVLVRILTLVASGSAGEADRIGHRMAEGERLTRAANLEEALALFRSVAVPEYLTQRRAQQQHNIGIICVRLERWAEAEEALKGAVQYDPQDVDAYYSLGRLAMRRGEARQAIEYLERALGIDKNHAGAQRLIAECKSGHVGSARGPVAQPPDD